MRVARVVLCSLLVLALSPRLSSQQSSPQISSVSPTTARAGDQIAIGGSGFGSSQGSGNVWLGSTYGVVVSWSDTQVIAAVASGSKTGVAQVLQGGVWSNAVDFTVITPNISSVTPTTAIAGTQITLMGTGFGTSQGSGNVWLGSTYGVVVSWSDTQIVANVASGSNSGVAQVLQGGVWSNTVNLTVSTPNITGVTPVTAIAGTQITITGAGFAASQGTGNVWLGSTYGVVVSWSDAQIVANVASGSKTGVAQVLQGGVWSNTVNFTVSTPNITNVSPTTAIAGTQITIAGTGFGASQGSGNVWLGSTYGVVVSWSDTQVVANVASGSKTGVAQVLQGGVWSNTVNLTVSTPNITSVTPTTAIAGAQITIAGTGFGASQGTGNVWLGSTYGVVVSWSDTQVVATVASGSQTGVAQILQGGVWSNSVSFAVTSLNITNVTPTTASTGAQVTISGTGFGATQGTSTLTFNGTAAAILRWSDTSIVAVVPSAATTGSVSVTVGGVTSNGFNVVITAPPTITGVSPSTATAGTGVTVTGSGFGSAQGAGTVTLGTRPATVLSWTDTQIVATVSNGSASGQALVRQNGTASNSVSFTVATPQITALSPTSGTSGTQVTIAGTGFGSAQGSGQVLLGTAPASVNSWSDTQVVATVASGANSGNAQILQNGVWSNSVPFTVTGGAPHITSITPNTGSAGTAVTIEGTGFRSLQGSGVVSIGATTASVNSWSDTQVSATVGSSAISGVAKIQQNGLWSNAVTFAVPVSSGGTQLTLNPNVITMLVGDTRSIQALGSNSQPVSGLTWTSSDNTIVTLSTDDPPILTAVAPGNVTITIGGASADVTVYAGSALPLGTILWSNPGDGSGVTSITPAVPSYTGVADVFAAQADCNVQAITTDGSVAWASALGQKVGGRGCKDFLADFQGGFVAVDPGFTTIVLNSDNVPIPVSTPGLVQRFDGITGQPYGAYPIAYPRVTLRGHPTSIAVHTDGTIFAIDGDSIVAIDPATGTKKFSNKMTHSTCQSTSPYDYLPTIDSNLMIAGDGYAYVVYEYTLGSGQYSCQPQCGVESCDSGSGHIEWHGRLLRVGTGGDSSEIALGDASEDWTVTNPFGYQLTQNGQIPQFEGTQLIITNADQGVLLSLYAPTPSYCAFVEFTGFDSQGFPIYVRNGCVDGTFNTNLITTSGSGIASQVTLPDNIAYIEPDLQAQDGTYFGIVDYFYGSNVSNDLLAKFDAAGNIQWSVPGYYAQMATADGGVIAQSADGLTTATFDANGSATGQLASLPTQSWRGNAYQSGSVEQVVFQTLIAATIWAFAGGNPSNNGSSGRPWYFILNWQNAFDFIPDVPSYLPNLKTDITSNAITIKTMALKALKSAYSQWPVVVVEGTAGTGDHQAVVQTSSTGMQCGDTNPNQTLTSTVYYECNMEEAQVALQVVINNTQDESNALKRQDLIQAIGRGIGNNAAHEIAHQFLLGCCSMDVLTSADPSAAATYNNGDADADPNPAVTNSDPAPYTGYGKDGKTTIHWESTTLKALTKCLAAGWVNYGASACSAKLQLSQNNFRDEPRDGVWAKALMPPETGRSLRSVKFSILSFLPDLIRRP